ncbi:hypothetical protein A7U58_15230 [Burkholderia pseudomallei]|nr:hypothetical protein A7U58_15230 [Burkholderia pseudomallei]ANW57306.1 hypothetical protein A7U59_15205 [Burkholderia pseudomallei]
MKKLRDITFDAILFYSAEGGIGKNDVNFLSKRVIFNRFAQRISPDDACRAFDAVQHHISRAKQMRESFLLYATY